MGNNLQGEWNTDTQSMQKLHMGTFTASPTEPLKYLTNQGPLPFAAIHFSTPTSRNHIGGASRFLRKGIVNSEWRPFGMADRNPTNHGDSVYHVWIFCLCSRIICWDGPWEIRRLHDRTETFYWHLCCKRFLDPFPKRHQRSSSCCCYSTLVLRLFHFKTDRHQASRTQRWQ